jgi:hypothetical protein
MMMMSTHTRDDFYGLSLIPVTSKKNISKSSYYMYTHCSVQFYQTTKYKTKMQLLKCLWKQIIYLYKQLVNHYWH